jgi:hypothetical protein
MAAYTARARASARARGALAHAQAPSCDDAQHALRARARGSAARAHKKSRNNKAHEALSAVLRCAAHTREKRQGVPARRWRMTRKSGLRVAPEHGAAPRRGCARRVALNGPTA